ncbi:hypothetical protein LguiA_013780 [Lonicera macranthoides]
MAFPWRRRKAGKKVLSGFNSGGELTIPSHFQCPISLELMKDPVTLSTGITYDRESIEKWIESGSQICPVTNQELICFDGVPNHTLRKMIQDWCVENRSYGVERIPTPRIPVSPYDVSEICSRIMVSTQNGDEQKCRELVRKIKTWAKASERNKRCIAENGAGYVLSVSFEAFARVSMEKHRFLLEEILSILVFMFPLGKEGQANLSSQDSLSCMALFLRGGDLSPKQHAVVTLKELLALDQHHINNLTKIKDVPESLFKIIKEPICPSSTKAALMVIYHMIMLSEAKESLISRFMHMGLVSLLLEILVGGERSLNEKALGVLDGICSSEKGREKVLSHALAVPVVVKKVLRVSAMATELSISILWNLCKHGEGESAMVEALVVGGFQKVLVVLQVGCDEWTKVKAIALLKLMNQYRGRLDCFDSSVRISN